MLYGMANNNVIIPAERDGALYNFLLGNQDYVFEGIGDEFEITPSASSFLITLGTGEGVVCGRHVTEETVNGANSMIQLSANSSGYVTICVDLSRPAGTEAYLRATPTLQQDDLNNSGTVRDLPLYQYTTNGSGVSSFVDVRNISAGSNVVCELSGGNLYVMHYEDGTITRKMVGALDPANLTATPEDVIAGKIFGGADSDEPLTGTRPNSGYAVTAKNNGYEAASGEVTCADGAIAYAMVCVKANNGSSENPPEWFSMQGWNGSEWETISLSRVSGGYCAGGSGGGSLNAWYWVGTFPKRYTRVKYSWPLNSVYARYTQLFLFK